MCGQDADLEIHHVQRAGVLRHVVKFSRSNRRRPSTGGYASSSAAGVWVDRFRGRKWGGGGECKSTRSRSHSAKSIAVRRGGKFRVAPRLVRVDGGGRYSPCRSGGQASAIWLWCAERNSSARRCLRTLRVHRHQRLSPDIGSVVTVACTRSRVATQTYPANALARWNGSDPAARPLCAGRDRGACAFSTYLDGHIYATPGFARCRVGETLLWPGSVRQGTSVFDKPCPL